jgi:hypothetical protein
VIFFSLKMADKFFWIYQVIDPVAPKRVCLSSGGSVLVLDEESLEENEANIHEVLPGLKSHSNPELSISNQDSCHGNRLVHSNDDIFHSNQDRSLSNQHGHLSNQDVSPGDHDNLLGTKDGHPRHSNQMDIYCYSDDSEDGTGDGHTSGTTTRDLEPIDSDCDDNGSPNFFPLLCCLQLIRPEEMTNPKIDEMSMMTYLSQFPNAKLKPGAPLRPRTNPKKVRAFGPGKSHHFIPV